MLDRLVRLNNKLKQIGQRIKALFQQNNASAYLSGIVAAKLYDLYYELLPHPANSPDLFPSEFDLFLITPWEKVLPKQRSQANIQIHHKNVHFFFF